MSTDSVMPISTHSDADAPELVKEILRPLIGVLLAGGLTKSQIRNHLEEALSESDYQESPRAPLRLGSKQRDCMEIMCQWRRDQKFLGIDGNPTALVVSGSPGSFDALCREVSASSPSVELLDTLLGFGAIEMDETGRVVPRTPTFILGSIDQARFIAIDGVLKQVAGFLKVIEHNTLKQTASSNLRFERACTVVIAEELVPIFENSVRERGELFIDTTDEWLERHAGYVSPSGRYVEVGVGAYFVDLGSVSKDKEK